MAQLESFSIRDIGGRERLEDYVTDEVLQTPSGLNLHIIVACDGAGGGDAGEQAARLTARTVIDYMQVSDATEVPALLIQAIEEANRVVYSEMSGTGSATIAMIAIDLDDSEYGRAFIANVGNSRIYLMRERELVRLNIDHTLANEYIYAGQMSANEAQRLENANYPTRVIGLNPDVQVDIGFYVEKGNLFVNAERAFNIGRNGMRLREGDTLFVATEGLFQAAGKGGSGPVVRDEEFQRHAMDDDVERASRNILRYASARYPGDNTSISMLFVPSRFRRPVRVTARLTPRQIAVLLSTGAIALSLIAFLGVQTWRQQEQIRDVRSLAIQATEFVLQQSATATSTPTATLTATPTATATISPTPQATDVRQAALQFFELNDPQPIPVLVGRRVTSPDSTSLLIIEGPNFDRAVSENANAYLQPRTSIIFDSIISQVGEETIETSFDAESEMYVQAGSFINGGVFMSMNLFDNVQLDSRSRCFAVRQIPPDLENRDDFDKLAFTCFTGQDGDCTYTFPGEDPVAIPVGRRVLLNLESSELVTDDESPLYERIKLYYDTVVDLSGSDADATCLAPYLDEDGDGILYPQDICEFDAGTEITEGCPDADGDAIRDSQDACPNEAGLVDFDGCPPPEATQIPDVDGDGLVGAADECPFEPGPASNNGCALLADEPRLDFGYGGG